MDSKLKLSFCLIESYFLDKESRFASCAKKHKNKLSIIQVQNELNFKLFEPYLAGEIKAFISFSAILNKRPENLHSAQSQLLCALALTFQFAKEAWSSSWLINNWRGSSSNASLTTSTAGWRTFSDSLTIIFARNKLSKHRNLSINAWIWSIFSRKNCSTARLRRFTSRLSSNFCKKKPSTARINALN